MEHIVIANSRPGTWCLPEQAPGAAGGRRDGADPVRGDGGLLHRDCLPPPVG